MPVTFLDEKPKSKVTFLDNGESDLQSTVTDVHQEIDAPPADIERAKTIHYLNKKGYNATTDNADAFRNELFGKDMSWGAVNKQISNQLSVEPTGDVKKTAKMSPKYAWDAFRAGLARTAMSGVSGIVESDKWMKQTLLPLYEKVGLGGVARWSMGVDAKVIEKTSAGEKITYDYYTQNVPDEVKESIGFQASEAIGQIPMMALYMTPATLPVALATTFGQSFDEGYDEALGAGKSEEQALNVGIATGVINGTIEAVVDKLTVGLGGDLVKLGKRPIKEAFKDLGISVGKWQAMAGADFLTETFQSGVTQKLATGEVNARQAFFEGFMGWITSQVAGPIFGSVNIMNAKGVRKNLEGMGMTRDEANDTLRKMAEAKNQEEADLAVNDMLDIVFERIGERTSKLLDGPPQARDVTGMDGGPLTTDDIQWLRDNPEAMNNLDDSPEADLLRRAVNDNDLKALAEYNQGVVGVEADPDTEYSDLTINGKPVQIMEEDQSQERDMFIEDFVPMDQEDRAQATDEQRDAEDSPAIGNPDAPIPQVVGTSRRTSNKINETLGLSDVSPAERRTSASLINQVIIEGHDKEGLKIADGLNAGTINSITDEDVAAILIAKADKLNEIEDLQIKLNETVESGNEMEFNKLMQDLDVALNEAERLSEGMRRGGTITAQALQAMSIHMDRKSFNLVNIMAEATKNKGEKLSDSQKDQLTELSNELKQWEGLAEELQSEIDTLEEQLALDEAKLFIQEELSRTRVQVKKKKNKESRDAAKKALESMGYRVNDITGLPIEVSTELAKIAISHIKDGASTIEEVVSRTMADVPDVSPKNIYDALGGRVKKDAKKVKSEVEQTLGEMKKQAKLLGDIDDSINGLALSTGDTKADSKKVSDLKQQLKLYASSVIQSERDQAKAEAVLNRVAHIEELVEHKARDLKITRMKSPELKEAEKKLAVANAEMSAQDRLFILKEIVEQGAQPVPKGEKPTITSERLENLRSEISALEQLIKEQNKRDRQIEADQKKVDKKDAEALELIDQLENLHRKIKTKKERGEDVNADLKLELKRQDKIFKLIEELNNGKPESEKIEKVDPEDSKGYLGMIKLLEGEVKAKRAEEAKKRAEERKAINADERLDSLIDQFERVYRDIPKPRQEKDKTDTQKDIEKYREGIRDQDKVFELLDVLRNKKVTKSEKKGPKNDPFGLKQEIQELRQEIKDSEWYQAAKQAEDEANALVTTKEDISQMRDDLKNNNLEPYMTGKQKRIVKSEELINARLEAHRLKKEINKRIRDLSPTTRGGKVMKVYDAFRAAKLTMDVGHILRQGGYLMSNPFRGNILKFGKQSFDALMSEDKANALDLWVINNPYYTKAENAGLRIIKDGQELDGRERIISDNILENVKGVGKVVTASARTQLTSMNVLRMSMFESLMEANPDATQEEMSDYAFYVNVATGYGQQGFFKRTNKDQLGAVTRMLDNVLISSRFKLSRMQTPFLAMSPRILKNPVLRRRAFEDLAMFMATRALLIFGLEKMFGDDITIGRNPDHAGTFGKLIVNVGGGKVRVYDPWAGMKNTMNALWNISQGEPPISALLDDLKKSQHPFSQFMSSMITGEKYGGDEASRWELAGRAFMPISTEGPLDAVIEQTGTIDGIISTALDVIGVNSYTTDREKIFGKTDLEALRRGNVKPKTTVYKWKDRQSEKSKRREREETIRRLEGMK